MFYLTKVINNFIIIEKDFEFCLVTMFFQWFMVVKITMSHGKS